MAVRPIDANALLDHIKDLNTWYNDDGYIYGYDMKYPDGMFFPDDIIASIENTPTLTQPNEWVSVEERLPEDDAPAGRKQITVLVCSKAKKVLVASRIYEPERDYNGKVYPARWRWSKLMNNYVTHWMPLPAPPDRSPPEGEEET